MLKRPRHPEAEGGQTLTTAAPARPAPGGWLSRPLVLTLGAILLLVAGAGIGVLLGRSTPEERTSGLPLGSGARETPGAVSPELDALRKEVETEDVPTRALLAFGHLALDEGQVPTAIRAYKRVLAREPRNAEAITHMGIILYEGGHVEQALARVDEALTIDPSYVHARWDRAQMLFAGKKDFSAAGRALEDFLRLVPTGDDALRARAMLEEARRQVDRMSGSRR